MDESQADRAPFNRTRLIPVTLSLYLILALALFILPSGNAESSGSDINREIEQVLLSENWSRVGSLLDHVNPETPSPVLRLIKAHAELAQNRNNESLSLFVQLTVEDLQTWQSWSADLAARQGNKSIPNYLLGDAYARAGNLDQAHALFSKAIEANDANYLAWNARGVSAALRGDYDGALTDFSKGLSIRPNFVDAMNNVGMMRIRQGQGRKGAIKRFRDVIGSAPDMSLAYHGLGCLELLVRGVPEENVHIQKALELAPDLHVFLLENERRFLAVYWEKQAALVYGDSTDEGTSLQKQFFTTDAAINHLNKATKLQADILSDNRTSDFHRNMIANRVAIAKNGVLNQFQSMTEARTVDYARSRPELFDVAANAVHNLRKDTARNLETLNNTRAGSAAAFGALTIGTSGAPLVAVGVGTMGVVADRFAERGIKKYEAYHETIRALDTRFGSVRNAVPDSHDFRAPSLTSGTFSVPRGYTAPSIPTPRDYRGSINRMDDHGGATTDKARVTWDNHEWPFVPIFGLLYFVPEQSVVVRGG